MYFMCIGIVFVLSDDIHVMMCSISLAYALYARKIKRLIFSKSKIGSDVGMQLVSSFQSFVISFYLSTSGFSVFSINCN
jgi:hypothetical protein